MPDRNPFEETMRAGMNVPQRTIQPGSAFGRGQGWQRAGPATGLVDYEDYRNRTGLGIFGGRNAGPASDTVSAILGGMDRGQEEGFDSFPPGTPDMQIQQEWERLKQIYFDNKYGGYTPGDYTS